MFDRQCFWPIVLVLSLSTIHSLAQDCLPTENRLCFQEGRISATATFQNFAGNRFSLAPAEASGDAIGQSLNSDTGIFWFGEPEEIEILVKVLNGTPLNGYFWVFVTSTSNFEVTLKITDHQLASTKTYHSPAGDYLHFLDTEALPGAAVNVAEEKRMTGPNHSEPAIEGTTVGAGPACCLPGPETLCLLGGRLKVSADWQDFGGSSGVAQANGLTDRSGLFSFFDTDRPDVLVKAVDGAEANGQLWFFAGLVANITVRLIVTDTLSGESQVFLNPLPRSDVFADNSLFVPEIHLAQYGGGGGLATELTLFNTSSQHGAIVQIAAFGGAPPPQGVGNELMIPPRGRITLSSPTEGPVSAGSLSVIPDQRLGAVVRYEITGIGAAAVGPGEVLRSAMIPVRLVGEKGINTGLAFRNVKDFTVSVDFFLLSLDGNLVPGGESVGLELEGGSRRSIFFTELFPDVAFGEDFEGTLLVQTEDPTLSLIALELGKGTGEFSSISPSALR